MKNLSTLIRSFFTSRANPKDIGHLITRRHVAKPKRRRRKRRPRKTCIICNRNAYHILISTKGIYFKKSNRILMAFTRYGTITINGQQFNWPLLESDIPDTITRDTDLATHTADANAHHTWPLTDTNIPASIARDSEVAAAIATHAADSDAHHTPGGASHDPVTLDADANTFLSLSAAQVIGLDNQSGNKIFASPANGSSNEPTFRTMVDADIPSSITRDSELTAHASDSDAHHNWPLTATDIPANSIDDTKAGDRVPQFYRRQGGSSSNWSTQGTTNRTPGAVRMQAGVKRWSGGAGSTGDTNVTFPTSFSNAPIILVTPINTSNGAEETRNIVAGAGNQTSSSFGIMWQRADPDTQTYTTINFAWLAIGPE